MLCQGLSKVTSSPWTSLSCTSYRLSRLFGPNFWNQTQICSRKWGYRIYITDFCVEKEFCSRLGISQRCQSLSNISDLFPACLAICYLAWYRGANIQSDGCLEFFKSFGFQAALRTSRGIHYIEPICDFDPITPRVSCPAPACIGTHIWLICLSPTRQVFLEQVLSPNGQVGLRTYLYWSHDSSSFVKWSIRSGYSQFLL